MRRSGYAGGVCGSGEISIIYTFFIIIQIKHWESTIKYRENRELCDFNKIVNEIELKIEKYKDLVKRKFGVLIKDYCFPVIVN